MKWTTEAKVGAFTLIGIALFAYAIFFLGHIQVFAAPEMTITGRFASVSGLVQGNSVRYSGVTVGKVKSVDVSPKGVTVIMTIKEGTEIPVDSSFSLQSDGILGEKFVSIVPGDKTEYLHDGDSVNGNGTSTLDATLTQAQGVMGEAEKTLSSINSIIGDKNTQTSLRNSIHNTDELTKNMADLTGQMNQLLAQNTGNVNQIAGNMAEVSRNMNIITTQLSGSIQTLDGDKATSENLRHIIANLEKTSASVNKMAASMEGIVTDPQSAKDIKETLHNTAHITSVLNGLTGGGSSGSVTTDARLEMLYNTKDDRYSPNFNFLVASDKNIVGIGASHIGDGTKVDFNYGKSLGSDITARGGLFDGDVGVSIDWGLRGNKPFSLSVAAMDPNDVKYRIRGELRLFDNFYAVVQTVRPFSATNGGTYYGFNYGF